MAIRNPAMFSTFFHEKKDEYLSRLRLAFGPDHAIVAKFILRDPTFFTDITKVSLEDEKYRKAVFPDGDVTVSLLELVADLAKSLLFYEKYETFRQSDASDPM